MKNLVWLGKALSDTPLEGIVVPVTTEVKHQDGDELGGGEEPIGRVQKLSFMWLLKRLCREARFELANNPKTVVKASVRTFHACRQGFEKIIP